MLNKHYRALDHVIVAMAALKGNKPVLASKHLQQALKCSDYSETIAALDEANDVKPKQKVSLAQALSVVAKAAKKPAKKTAKKKKVKADADEGLDMEMTEDDLLGDDVEVAEGEDSLDEGEDLDLDSLELEDDEESLAGEEDMDLDTEGEGEEDDVLEMPEATADALGTDEDPTDCGADVTDNGEPPTDTTRVANPAETARRKAVKASQRILSNIQALESQDARVVAKVTAKAKSTK